MFWNITPTNWQTFFVSQTLHLVNYVKMVWSHALSGEIRQMVNVEILVDFRTLVEVLVKGFVD